MNKHLKKFIKIILSILFCGVYFYIIFINFTTLPCFHSKEEEVCFILMAVSLAFILPFFLCVGFHYITYLERKLKDAELIIKKLKNQKQE